MTIRINKYLADNGIAARRKIDELIQDEKVLINDRVAKLGEMIDPATDVIYVNGKKIEPLNNQDHIYIALNKPLNVLSTVTDARGRKTVLDYVKTDRRIFPIGRLDYNSTGLIILTDDGDLALKMTHPRYHVPKKYVVETNQKFTDSQLERMRNGLEIEGGKTQKCEITPLNAKTFEITLNQGMKRQIRYMCKKVGLVVNKLHRISIGKLSIGDLKLGEARVLSREDIEKLL